MDTEAWVLRSGNGDTGPAALELAKVPLPAIGSQELLVEPLIGCWEGNMSHALSRRPIDICMFRKEPFVILGNAGVVRVLKVGSDVRYMREGDHCMIFGAGEVDAYGYMIKAYGYDAAGTMGVLSKRTVIHERSLLKLPNPSEHSLEQWAAFSVRYITAWSNWHVAYKCWRAQVSDEDQHVPWAGGWGGGTTYATLELARLHGASAFMTASSDARLAQLKKAGIIPIDRRPLADLERDEERLRADPAYRARHDAAHKDIAEQVNTLTGGAGVNLFFDYIGAPLWRTTLALLARQGVVATAGWKLGMKLSLNRAVECIARHTMVHTHYARRSEAIASIRFAERAGWLPTAGLDVTEWNDIPKLAAAHQADQVASYFPLFRINT